jgi:6,7-dimethyl-8-ribityllumazine synthase
VNQRNQNTSQTTETRRIAFVQACWHRDITDQCRNAFLGEMERHGFAEAVIDCHEVPGAFEIPLYIQRLAMSGRYDAVVATAFIVDGGIYAHEYVSEAVINGMMRVQLDTGVPVMSAVLTPRHFHEHDAHQRFFADHFRVKGEEVANACAATLANMRRLNDLDVQAAA